MTKKDSNTTQSNEKNIQHYNAILIEEIRSEMRFLAEMVLSIPEQICQKLEPRFKKIEDELVDIKVILKQHSQWHQEHFKRWDDNDKKWSLFSH